jgi:hypothetical protein
VKLVSNTPMVRTIFVGILAGLLGGTCMAQPLRPPDVEAQRAAMKKLDFSLAIGPAKRQFFADPANL